MSLPDKYLANNVEWEEEEEDSLFNHLDPRESRKSSSCACGPGSGGPTLASTLALYPSLLNDI